MGKISDQDFKRLGITEEARKLHEESIVVDLHVDPIIQQVLFSYDLSEEHNFTWKPRKRKWLFNLLQMIAHFKKLHHPFFNHIDIPRMVKGGYTFAAFGIHYWPIQSEKGWESIKRQIHYFRQLVEKDDRIIQAKSPKDIRKAFKQKKLAGFIGVEGAHCLGRGGKHTLKKRLDRIEEIFERYGVRYLTLAHFSKNDAATPAIGLMNNAIDGLTEFGKDLIRVMNEVGMIVDVAHVNNQGVLDACKMSNKPVIVTHTGLAGKNLYPRNISNEALKAVADTGGVIGVIFATNFLSRSRKNPSLEIVLEHIEHIITQVGENHVAIGTDFDGWIPRIPQDIQDASDLPLLTQGMLTWGYTHKQIKNILGENFLQVWELILGM